MRNALAAAAVALLSACATTKVETTWKAPSFQADAPQKAVVVAVIKDPIIRRKTEDSLVDELRKKGVNGVASYTFAPDREITREQLAKEVSRQGADTVLISTVVDRRRTQSYVPPTASGPGYYGYYSSSWNAYYSPGYTVTREEAISEVKAFDVKDQRQVWGARLSTNIDNGVNDRTIREFCKKVVKNFLANRETGNA